MSKIDPGKLTIIWYCLKTTRTYGARSPSGELFLKQDTSKIRKKIFSHKTSSFSVGNKKIQFLEGPFFCKKWSKMTIFWKKSINIMFWTIKSVWADPQTYLFNLEYVFFTDLSRGMGRFGLKSGPYRWKIDFMAQNIENSLC